MYGLSTKKMILRDFFVGRQKINGFSIGYIRDDMRTNQAAMALNVSWVNTPPMS